MIGAPEDEALESTGKKVAYQNLWISIPALLWLRGGGIITMCRCSTLGSCSPRPSSSLLDRDRAGIAGATMRIPGVVPIRLAGGRNTIFLTTAMLLAPALGTGIVLQSTLTGCCGPSSS